jgi:hypothetical protein
MYRTILLIAILALVTIIGIGCSSKKASEAAQTANTVEPIQQPSKFAAFQPDSVFKVVRFETFTGNGLVRAVVERTDGNKFSAILIRKPGPNVGDRVVQVGDVVKLAEITFIRNAPSGCYGPTERMLVIQM